MIYKYFVNIKKNGKGFHEIHRESCLYLPVFQRRIDLGYFENSKEALHESTKFYPTTSGCYWCSPELLLGR